MLEINNVVFVFVFVFVFVQYTSPPTMLFTIGFVEDYSSRQTINRFAYITGTRNYVVRGKHATSTTYHRKPV